MADAEGMNIIELPQELLICIFGMVNGEDRRNLRTLCRVFRNALTSPTIWKHRTAYIKNILPIWKWLLASSRQTESGLPEAKSKTKCKAKEKEWNSHVQFCEYVKGCNIQNLIVSMSIVTTRTDLVSLSPLFPNLKRLDINISSYVFFKPNLLEPFEHCKHLKSLQLNRLNGLSWNFSSTSRYSKRTLGELLQLFPCLNQLSLNFSICQKITQKDLDLMADALSSVANLTSLELHNFCGFAEEYSYLSYEHLKNSIKLKCNIKRLGLRSCPMLGNTFERIFLPVEQDNTISKLQSLCLSGSLKSSWNSDVIKKKLSDLNTLVVEGENSITIPFAPGLFQNLQALELVNLQNVQDASLTLYRLKLKELKFINCYTISGFGVKILASAVGQTLLSLTLNQCDRVCDSGLSDLKLRFPCLTYLDISGCRNLSKDFLARNYRYLPYPKLKRLILKGCPRFIEPGVSDVLQQIRQLVSNKLLIDI